MINFYGVDYSLVMVAGILFVCLVIVKEKIMNKAAKIIIGLILLVVLAMFGLTEKYLDWLWFKDIGTTAVFWASLLTGPLTKIILGLFVFGFFYGNFIIAKKSFERLKNSSSFWSEVSPHKITLIGLICCVLPALVMSIGFMWIGLPFNNPSTG